METTTYPINPLLTVGLPTLTAVVWAALAQAYCRCHGTVRPEGGLLRLFQVLGWLFALHYGGKALIALYPPAAFEIPVFVGACLVAEVTSIAVMPILRHLVRLGTLRTEAPSGTWLAINYGLAAVALLDVDPRSDDRFDVFEFYLLGLSVLILWDLVRLARERRRPLLMADLGFRGYLLLALGLLVGVVVLVITERGGVEQSLVWTLSHGFVGLLTAVPFALRILGEVVRRAILFGLRMLVALGLVLGFHQATTALDALDAGTQRTLDLAFVLLLMLALGPGVQALTRLADGLVLHRSDRWREELQQRLESFDPTADPQALQRHATENLVEVLRLQGAALWLPDTGGPVTEGPLDIAALVAQWPWDDGDHPLPQGVFDVLWVHDPEVQEAMLAARVTWVASVASGQRQWGHLFVSAGIFGHAATHAKLDVLRDYAHELALRLDVAELLGRTRRIEREMAQQEKLAALGETAARLAHEIRNPVTAARSLAQLVTTEPTAEQNVEHSAMIVEELDRVERHVQAMLQLTRQDSHRPVPLDLESWLRDTVQHLERCKLFSGIPIDLDLDGSLWVQGDPERLRQVLVNLLSNAADALARVERARIVVGLRAHDAGVELTVMDNGPGIPAAIEPRLFEPFVSSKTRGTGLGLAIARRILDNHGGELTIGAGSEGGTVARVWLPGTQPSAGDRDVGPESTLHTAEPTDLGC